MRSTALGSIRARVERLVSDWPSSPEPTFVYWESSDERCPRCAADLAAFAQASALAKAVEGRAPGAPPPKLVFYCIDDELTRCPQCGAPLPV